MSRTKALRITLPVEIARMVEAKVASGEYRSESDVVREGLEDMIAHDAALERWLHEEVLPTYDAMRQDPSRGLSLEEAKAELDSHIARRKRSSDV